MELIRYISEFCPFLAACLLLRVEEANEVLDIYKDDHETLIINLVKLNKLAKIGMIRKRIGLVELAAMQEEKIKL
jgi:uncharacterized protein (UPF0128 family)